MTKNNFLAAVGNTKGSLLQVNLTANTDLHTADQFKQLVVRQDKNTLVRLGDIADIVLGAGFAIAGYQLAACGFPSSFFS